MNKLYGTAVSISVAGGLVLASASESQAAPSLRSRAETVAESHIGDRYVYGATGPHTFDCSGLVKYSFGKVGKTLPRTAQQQYNKSKHISWASRTKGALVAIGPDRNHITHVGLYVGSWSGKSWMVNANTGAYRGRKVVIAPVKEYTTHGNHAYYGIY